MYSSSAAASTPRSNNKVHDDNDARSFLSEIETTVARVLAQHGSANLQDLALTERESVGVARHLDQRLGNLQRNNDCRTCWLQRAHCICQSCPAVHNDGTNNATPNRVARLRRLFLVYHHKEICLAVDTAKLLASTLPVSLDASASQVRVVVGGIPAEFQDSMKELEEAVVAGSCLVLFPDETARTWKEFQQERHIIMNDDDPQNNNNLHYNETTDYDVIVLDGTWEQARKLYRRYVPDEASGGPYRIQLETEALERIISGESGADGGDENPNASGGTGRQLRRHPVLWREIGTTAATASLLQDMDPDGPWERILATYQQRADAAARAQLGAPRMRLREQKRERS
jgi:DTW domain-containing protein YfiP